MKAFGRGRTTLGTRTFVVIVVATVIPSLLLAGLAAYAYFRSWDSAGVLYRDQAKYNARGLADEVASLRSVPESLSAAEKQRVVAAIVGAYGRGNLGGAWRSTMNVVDAQSVLPAWAVRSLRRNGYAVGDFEGPRARSAAPDIVAWRVGERQVRYYTSESLSAPDFFDVPLHRAPLGRLAVIALGGVVIVVALGVLGALLLTRGVVRPVRRVAQASRRLAEGGDGEPVVAEGPRETRELAEAFNEMNARLRKAQEAEQSFLLSVSHELKTPLTSIRGYAEGLRDGALPPAEAAGVIGAESARLERLVGDLLDSARMRKSAFAVRREPVDLAATARDVARRHEATARGAGLVLDVQAEADCIALADTDRVLQVVSNLVENALRCTPAPGQVTIAARGAAITVTDNGRGLTGEDLPRAFERFYLYSRYGNDRPVGTGLGLAIVKELAEAMGGSVAVTSAVGVGTSFQVTLPSPNGSGTDEAATTEGSAPSYVPGLGDESR